MTRRLVATTTVLATALLAAACDNAGDSPKPPAAAQPPGRSSEMADRTAPAGVAAAASMDVCALLPAAEVTAVTGLPIERAQKKPDGCEWFATAAAQRPRGAAGPNPPVFAVTVRHGDADQAELMLRGRVSMNGGQVEPIEGLGDRAFAGPMGAFFYARKGSALIMFNGIGTRAQTIALAKRIVPRIQ